MAYSVNADVLKLVANRVCRKEYAENAYSFLKEKRGVSINFLNTPYLTGDLTKFVSVNSGIFKKDWLSDCLYFPIFSLFDGGLLGFDVRYVGKDEERVRYFKLKMESDEPFFYGSQSFFESVEFVFVCEGVVDCETLRMALDDSSFKGRYAVLSPLTCLTSNKFLKLLSVAFPNVVIAYDNDSAGLRARQKIVKFEKENELEIFGFLDFLGKDVNESANRFGMDSLRLRVEELFNSFVRRKLI